MGPFKVKALYEYTSNHEDDLPFQPGQIVTVIDEEDADWYVGEYVDDSGVKLEGIFPRNFVEKYEPTAPPRPTRVRKREPDTAPASDAAPTTPAPTGPAPPEPVGPPPEQKSEEAHREPAVASPPTPPAAEPHSPPAPVAPVSLPPQSEPVSAPTPPTPVAAPANESPSIPSAPAVPSAPSAQASPKEPAQTKKPPPIAGKSNAFKDRIAAFNKPAAPPVAPFKPGGLSAGPSGFVKKPFVAPPPSRNAYIPPVQQSPAAKVYRREEDPEIKERQLENQDNAEKSGLAPVATTEGEGEDQPKPTSLKERIALLQRQQAEQAQRHAEAAKKKPKRPPPKRTESESAQDQPPVADEAEAHPRPLERKDTAELASKKSLDVSRSSLDEASPPRQPPPMPTRRRSTKGPVEKDGNEADMSGAGDTTEGPEDLTEKEDSDAQAKPIAHVPEPATAKPAEENAEEGEEEDEEDPEARRREELRARMAKMSGGMGFHGMFGPPGMSMGAPPMPPKKKKPPTPERRSSEMTEPSSPRAAPPIPTMMALPGLGKQKAKEEEPDSEQAEATEETATPVATATSPQGEVPEHVAEPLSPTSGGAPPIPGSRPAPPPVPTQSRPPPPPPPAGVLSPGSETDDELSERPQVTPLAEALPIARAPPPPPVPVSSPPLPSSPRASVDRGYTGFSTDEPPVSSPPMSPQFNKRNSRPPPPPPSNAPPPTLGRPPPPPPPGGASRPSTSDERVVEPMKPGTLDNGEEAEGTEYEGDYDTDIASSAPHKGALKSHSREWSLEDDTPHYEAPPSQPPPPPAAAAPSTGPPPVPSQPPPNSRMSVDKPRAPPPPPKSPPQAFTNEDYDPFNYNAAQSAPATQSFSVARHDDSQVAPEVTPSYQAPPPRGTPLAPQPPREPPRAPPRKSLDVQRVMAGRRSTDAGRASISAETGFMANDVDLATQTNWWLSPNGLPPVFQGRKDIYSESTEATSSTPEGRTVVTKEVLILFQDYSQTAITILFDPQDPSSTEVDQRHEPPPRTLRQDQLEQAYETYGRKIATAIASRKDSVGDGTSHGLISELLKPFQDALRPVGTRSYGALVYANLANASTQMNDEIRPGDIVSFRNAKFSGKHGPMHAKYSTEVGKPDHVGVVAEWDGTKKKVRAWEQGRESKKCKQESFKLEDLRSGEVKVWRVMPRSWVGWSNTPGYSASASQD